MGYSGKDLLQLLIKRGRRIDRIHGSHYVLCRGGKRVVVPVHSNRDLPKGTYFAILKQAGVKTSSE